MSPDSIFANKLVALYERFKNRDLYDVNFFLKNEFPLNEGIITERT
jgi:predicted nucleotidyltransferase component of viral defense system